MADPYSYRTKHQKLLDVSDQNNQQNSSKFPNNLLYKIVTVIVFIVILPLFPSQAPEFINQTLLTRSWELLHLLLVGIAVSYGLFGRKNYEETDQKENNTSSPNSKFDNAHLSVSTFLDVSSIFDDEAESPSASDENKAQTWNNQYFRDEPVVVLAQEQSVLNKNRVQNSRVGEKPLLLPVRSLKSRVLDPDVVVESNESRPISPSVKRVDSKSGSKRFLSNSGRIINSNGQICGLDHKELEDKSDEDSVLPSPIPWRSRSGRLEMKEVVNPSMEEFESNGYESRSFKPQKSHIRPNTMSPPPSLSSPKKSSLSGSPSPESLAKSYEDFVRKKTFYRPPPPPPPPPAPMTRKSSLMKQTSWLNDSDVSIPPPPMTRKSSSMKQTSWLNDSDVSITPPPMTCKSSSMKQTSWLNDRDVSIEKDFRRSFTTEPKDYGRSGENRTSGINSSIEINPRNWVDRLSMGRPVRTIRGDETVIEGRKGRGIGEDEMDGKLNKAQSGVDQLKREIGRTAAKPTVLEFPEEEKEVVVEKVVMEFDGDTETEDDNEISGGESLIKEEASSSNGGDAPPDVDKKADEFIAKFREQIRLQRIASIKRSSTSQITRGKT